MGDVKKPGWRGIVGCGLATLVALIVAVALATFILPTLICGTGHARCPGTYPPAPSSSTVPIPAFGR